MGAPTPATKAKAKARTKKGPTPPTIGPDVEITDADIEKLTAEVDAAVDYDGSPIGPDGEIRPIIVGKAGKAGPEMTHIFTVGGVKYFVRKSPAPAIMLRFMREARDKHIGRDVAVSNAMLAMLGKTALDALSESEDTSDEDFAAVFTVITYLLFGAIKRWRAASDPSSSAPPS